MRSQPRTPGVGADNGALRIELPTTGTALNPNRGRIGFAVMRHRAEALGGTLDVVTREHGRLRQQFDATPSSAPVGRRRRPGAALAASLPA